MPDLPDEIRNHPRRQSLLRTLDEEVYLTEAQIASGGFTYEEQDLVAKGYAKRVNGRVKLTRKGVGALRRLP